jgi:hypothetical protein
MKGKLTVYRLLLLGILFLDLIVLLFHGSSTAQAVDTTPITPSGPNRFEEISQEYLSYQWWLTSWKDNSVLCILNVDHEDLPTNNEIYLMCGKKVYDLWSVTQPCPESGTCRGYYLQSIQTSQETRKITQALPPASVWLSMEGCEPWNSTLRCNVLPQLILTGVEPMEGQAIINVEGTIDGSPFTCESACKLEVLPTSPGGMELAFWANSTYGDTSELFHARVRVAGSQNPDEINWYMDVLSSQWQGPSMASCSLEWDAFPPAGGPPRWLSSPSQVEQLATSRSYSYLAAQLINRGVVDIRSCTDGGVLETGMASPCGMDAARLTVIDWQNRFNDVIFSETQKASIPGYLLKAIFSRESQFWPIRSPQKPEAGLGHLTENGADTTLLWNRSFYDQYCPEVLENDICQRGYANLQDATQLRLRTALFNRVNADCPTCAIGIDMRKAEDSISVFANLLKANCIQTGTIVHNSYGGSPGSYASFEDLWKFTLVNYNAGPGCLILAIREVKKMNEPLDWKHLASHLTQVCQPAMEYVNDVNTFLEASIP